MIAIPPKPTYFDGIEYRSRLEARWAVFFTVCGYSFMYEPRGATTPDFVIFTNVGTLCIEVKGFYPNEYYLQELREAEIDYLAVGGFFQGMLPELFCYPDYKENHMGIWLLKFPVRQAFSIACNHRFDR